MTLFGGQTEDVIQRWVLDPTQYAKGIKDVATLIRQQTKHEKDLDLVRQELDKSTDKLTSTTNALAKSSDSLIGGMTKGVTAGNLWSAAIQKGIGYIKEGIADVDKYSKVTNVFSGNLDKLKEATGGTIGAMELMAAQNKLVTLGIKLTDAQMGDLLASTKKLAPAMGIDMASALESVSTALARSSEKIADNVGVVMNVEAANKKFADSLGVSAAALTDEQKRLAFVNEMLGQMHDKAAATADATATLTDNFSKFGVYIKDNLLELLSRLNSQFGTLEGWDPLSGYRSLVRSKDVGATRRAYMGKPTLQKAYMGQSAEEAEASQREYEAMTGVGGGYMAGVYREEPWSLGFGSAAEGTGTGTYGVGSWRKEAVAADKYTHGAALSTYKKPKTGGRGKKAHPWWDHYLEDLAKELAKELDEEAAYVMAEEERKLKNSRAEKRKGREEGIEAGADDDRRRLEREFKQFGRETAVDKLSGTFAGSMMSNKVAEAATRSAEALEKYRAQVQGINADMESFTVGSLQNFTAGMWAAADAAIMGGDSFGMAMAKMLKATLLGIAQQSTVKAIFNLAEAAAQWFNPHAVSMHLTAAALYGSIAVITGAAGLGMSAAMAGSSAGAGAGSHNNAGSNTYRPSYGSREAADKKPIVINVWLGGKGDLAATLYMRQQIRAAAA